METDKLLFKRLIREYEFLMEDLEDLYEIKSKVDVDFMEHLKSIDTEDVLNSTGIEGAAKEWADTNKDIAKKEHEEQDDRDPIFKKIFRSIVVKCHPDKLGPLSEEDKKYYNNLYTSAVEANETLDWALLIRTAIKLNVTIPEGAYSKITEIKENLDKLRAKQSAIVNSTAWGWYHASDSTGQEDILKNHLSFLKTFNKGL